MPQYPSSSTMQPLPHSSPKVSPLVSAYPSAGSSDALSRSTTPVDPRVPPSQHEKYPSEDSFEAKELEGGDVLRLWDEHQSAARFLSFVGSPSLPSYSVVDEMKLPCDPNKLNTTQDNIMDLLHEVAAGKPSSSYTVSACTFGGVVGEELVPGWKEGTEVFTFLVVHSEPMDIHPRVLDILKTDDSFAEVHVHYDQDVTALLTDCRAPSSSASTPSPLHPPPPPPLFHTPPSANPSPEAKRPRNESTTELIDSSVAGGEGDGRSVMSGTSLEGFSLPQEDAVHLSGPKFDQPRAGSSLGGGESLCGTLGGYLETYQSPPPPTASVPSVPSLDSLSLSSTTTSSDAQRLFILSAAHVVGEKGAAVHHPSSLHAKMKQASLEVERKARDSAKPVPPIPAPIGTASIYRFGIATRPSHGKGATHNDDCSLTSGPAATSTSSSSSSSTTTILTPIVPPPLQQITFHEDLTLIPMTSRQSDRILREGGNPFAWVEDPRERQRRADVEGLEGAEAAAWKKEGLRPQPHRPQHGSHVLKVGMASGATYGVVSSAMYCRVHLDGDVPGTATCEYTVREATPSHGRCSTGRFGHKGDSGSIVFEPGVGPVGLLTSSNAHVTFMMDLTVVLEIAEEEVGERLRFVASRETED